MNIKDLIMRLSAVVSVILIAGCATTSPPAVANQENGLVAAGFKVVPADTPLRQNALYKMPNRIVRRTSNATVAYLYGDPVVCHCVYVGDRAAFVRYQANLRAANQSAPLDDEASDDFRLDMF